MTDKLGDSVLYLTSDIIGSGDDKLGGVLMKSFLNSVEELDHPPHVVLLLNGAVKLAVEGAKTLDTLQRLEAMGVKIWACGTCLDFFDLKAKLGVGKVGCMRDTVELLNKAGRVIKP